jgi:hypothetical protein
VLRGERWYQVVNPLLKEPSTNKVMLSLLKDSDVDRRIEEVFALYRTHGLPFKWAIGPMSSPDRLEQQITIRLDRDTVTYFKKLASETGIAYQILINLFLKDCAISK